MRRNKLFVLTTVLGLALAPWSEARVGSRGSYGSRGSRSYSMPRGSAPGSGYSANRFGSAPNSRTAPGARPGYGGYGTSPYSNRGSDGAFSRGLMGGLAGSFLGSLLFRGSGYGMGGMMGPGYYGYGGAHVGLLDLLLIGGLIYFFVSRRRRRIAAAEAAYQGREHQHPFSLAHEEAPLDQSGFVADEQAAADVIQDVVPHFRLADFKERRITDFLQIQAAWNQGSLLGVRSKMNPDIYQELSLDLEAAKRRHRLHPDVAVTVRDARLVEAWSEYGRLFATLRFIVDDFTRSGASEEFWTFARPIVGSEDDWKLTAIQWGQEDLTVYGRTTA